jgi:hypothetical protein
MAPGTSEVLISASTGDGARRERELEVLAGLQHLPDSLADLSLLANICSHFRLMSRMACSSAGLSTLGGPAAVVSQAVAVVRG